MAKHIYLGGDDLVLTIRAARPINKARTSDKGATLASLWIDLYDRLLSVAAQVGITTKDDYDPAKHPHAPAGLQLQRQL